jgi:Protein of unknown function (DUF3106)
MRLPGSHILPAVLLAAAVTMPGAFGQKKNPAQRGMPEEAKVAKPPRANPPGGGKGPDAAKKDGMRKDGRPAPNPFTAIDRWNAMNPRQRERMLSKMPPERRKQFLDKLDRFNSLPKEEQQLLRERQERLSHLPPEEQQLVRRDGARFEKLPPARRQAMLDELQKLRKMSESERTTYFSSSEFKDKFYPAEQQMIENFAKVLPLRK